MFRFYKEIYKGLNLIVYDPIDITLTKSIVNISNRYSSYIEKYIIILYPFPGMTLFKFRIRVVSNNKFREYYKYFSIHSKEKQNYEGVYNYIKCYLTQRFRYLMLTAPLYKIKTKRDFKVGQRTYSWCNTNWYIRELHNNTESFELLRSECKRLI